MASALSVKICLYMFLIGSCYVSLSTSTDEGAGDGEPPVVKTSTATYRGQRHQVRPRQLPDFQRNVALYSRIPFAEPPVGDLRYARPVGKNARGHFDATRDPVACSQVSNEILLVAGEESEDCLYLNVYVPEPQPEVAPVMVWIHGGGYHIGAGMINESQPFAFVAMGDVILVGINYRLGMLGFLATEDDAIPANIGLLDQRQALIWVQENIAAFGGDPNRVTILGESAGSASVNLHLLSPMSAGLFSGAIMQSGVLSPWTHFPAKEHGVQMTKAFAKDAGCDVTSSEELVACLKGKSVDELLEAQSLETFGLVRHMVVPVPDGEFLPVNPSELAAEGSFNPANIMIGCLSDEGTLMLPPKAFGLEENKKPVINQTDFGNYISMSFQNSEPLIRDILAYVYGPDDMLTSSEPNYIDAATTIIGDSMFLCPTFTLSQQLADAGHTVYAYFMTHSPSHSIWGKNFTWLGAGHGEDIPYMFGTPFTKELDDESDYGLTGRFTDEEVEMSVQMMKYWTNFAKTGDPNLSSTDPDLIPESKYPVWPKSTATDPAYKELSFSFLNNDGQPRSKRCYFGKKLLPSLLGNSHEMARLKALLEEKVDADSEKSCEDKESCPEH